MKKTIAATLAVLVVLMLLTMACSFAEENNAAPAESTDPLVGSWRMPPSPFGDDFAVYLVLNADGSFLNATNLFEEGKSSGPYTQTVTTNDTFRWTRIAKNTIELRFDYGDENGEFVSTLDYNPADDTLYMFGAVYARRDGSFVLLPQA